MRKRLNKSTVDRLQPGPVRYDVIDDQIRGFMVRVNTDGTKTAVLRYRRDGRNRAHKLGVLGGTFTVHEARRLASEARATVDAGGDPARQRDARKAAPTFAAVAERFMTEIVRPYRKPRTTHGYEGLLRVHLLPALGSMKIGDITRSDVQRLHQRIGASAPYAANRALALVSVIVTHAECWGYRDVRANPCHRMAKFPEQERERLLSGEERARLAAVLTQAAAHRGGPGHVSPGAIAVIRLLELTGARCSEITGLRWSMVDLEGSCLRLADSKTGPKMVPLSPQAVALLGELWGARVDGVPWVCPSESGGQVSNLQRAWRTIRRRAGLDDVRLHDLRHAAASDMAAAGLSHLFIGRVLGHKTSQATSRYTHLCDRTGMEAARIMGDLIERNTREGEERLRQREQQAVGADARDPVPRQPNPSAVDGGAKVILLRPRGGQ